MGLSINRRPKDSKIEWRKNCVKKTALALVILVMAIAAFVSISFSTKIVRAADAENAGYTIESVNHTIEVLYNGYIFVNDTVQINTTDQTPSNFLIGFPYVFRPFVLRCLAYNESSVFPVDLDAPLEDRVGFYGAKVNFPNGFPHVFTVLFVLSNDCIIHNATSTYYLYFPAFPSLTKPTEVCNVSTILPTGAEYQGGAISTFNYSQENLPSFTSNASLVVFSLPNDEIQVVDVGSMEREIRLNEFGEIQVSDTYLITNKATVEVGSFEAILPRNASNLRAQDQFGRTLGLPELTDEEMNRYNVTFSLPIKTDESTLFTVQYDLPKSLVVKEQANQFDLNISLFQDLNYYINQTSVKFVLPEGARILNLDTLIGDNYNLGRNVFQETVSINRQGMFSLDGFNAVFSYEYNPLWLSFRPTLWIWALSIVGCLVAIVWKRPEAPAKVTAPTSAVRLHPEYIRSFADAYEDKMKIVLDIESLETKVQKGRIPRRRYKVQRRTLETRLNTLSRDLAESKGKMRAAGGKYADLMRQLEIAETEINEVEANIKSIEVRQSRGEISIETYRKLLADYQRRREKTQTAITGILLRLREEIR
jgi:hypothetical protein